VPTDLAGLPIAITGASSGIGLATALACAGAGMPVALAARRLDRLDDAVRRISALGGRAIAVRCDVTNPADCQSLVDRTLAEFGSIHSIFANAGYGIEGPVHTVPDADFHALMDTNFWGTLHTIRPALPHFLKQGRGHVLICSSVVSKMGIPYLSAYSVSKAAQDHIGRAMRLELRGRVHVSTIHPIGTDTDFSRVVTEHSKSPRKARSPEGFRQTPEFVARRILACLRRPRGEVWTSTPARLLAALGTAWPSLADHILSKRFEPWSGQPRA